MIFKNDSPTKPRNFNTIKIILIPQNHHINPSHFLTNDHHEKTAYTQSSFYTDPK